MGDVTNSWKCTKQGIQIETTRTRETRVPGKGRIEDYWPADVPHSSFVEALHHWPSAVASCPPFEASCPAAWLVEASCREGTCKEGTCCSQEAGSSPQEGIGVVYRGTPWLVRQVFGQGAQQQAQAIASQTSCSVAVLHFLQLSLADWKSDQSVCYENRKNLRIYY